MKSLLVGVLLLLASVASAQEVVAGRFWTEGTQNEFRQQWSYDVTFCAPIALDPAAKTVPKK